MLERDHHLVQFAEQRHQLGDAQLFRVQADGTAGNAVIASALIRLSDKVDHEGGRVLFFLFRRVPFCIFDNALLIFRLALVGVQVDFTEIPLDVIQGTAHHLLHGRRRDLLSACHIRRDKGKGEQLVIRHGVIVADVVCLFDQLAIDLFALFHNVGGIFPAVFLAEHLFHGTLEHPKKSRCTSYD